MTALVGDWKFVLEIGILNKWVWLLVKYDDTKKIMHWLLVFCKNIVNRRINFIELHNKYLLVHFLYIYVYKSYC